MDESSEVQYDESKELPEKNKRRRFKTPSQVQALEDFYNEHKYPTESMKAELAEKLELTEKQVSGWFCHRRLKDKRIAKDETNLPGRQDLSSGIVQDRGSGLKQDSCSSTKQGDGRIADLKEVESRRFSRDDIASTDLKYVARGLYDGTEMEDDTSSESNSDLQENFYPKHRLPNDRGRAGPSGYLKIKGQTENAAITVVKRQLGRLYREDGPPLGIEFDPLPPGAFESPTKNTNHDAYGVHEPIVSGSGIHKRHGLNAKRNQDTRIEASDYRLLHKPEHDDFPHRQSKQKPSVPNHNRSFPVQKSSFGVDPYSPREIHDYDTGKNIQRKRDLLGMRSNPISEHQSNPYAVRVANESEEPWPPTYDNANPKVARRKQQLGSRASVLPLRTKNPINIEDRIPPTRILKDEEIYMERRPITIIDNHDSIRLKKRLTNEVGKRGREEFLQEDYANRTSSQELTQWSKHMKGGRHNNTELPSSFSEDETAETSSSVD